MKKEVREGYKITELGEIPDDWEIVNTDDIFDFSGGLSISRANLGNEGILYLHYGDIHKRNENYIHTEIDAKWLPRVAANYEELKDGLKLSTGTVVFADASEDYDGIGKSVVIFNEDEIPFVAGLHTIVAKDEDNKLDSNYKRYCFETKNVRKQFRALANGTSVYGISRENIKKIKILNPPIKEQKKIAEILSTVDEQIENTEKLIQKNKELKKGLMQQLLTKGIGHTEFKKTELGEIPKEWEIKLLEDLSIKIGDGLHGTPVYNKKGKYYFINGNNLNEGKIVLTNETKMIDKLEYEKYKKELNENTILLSLNGTIGNLSFYNYENIVLGKSVGYINLNDDIDKIYIFYALSSEDIKKYFYKELTGTTIKNLSLNTLRRTKIKVPTILEQQKIALILSSIDEKIEKIKEKKENLNKIKKGLMQQLLNGKIRVE
ncbi:TPA: restriction endonuclease subunit S [Clostridium perfringens]